MRKGVIAAAVVIVIAIVGALVYWASAPRPGGGHAPAQTGQSQPKPSGQTSKPHPAQPPQNTRKTNKPSGPPAERYCADKHDKSDTKRLRQTGGLVQIFQHEGALADAYGCAATYLKHGGDVNASDPRDDSEHLTPLLFAVKRNDPKMMHFLLDHGADPQKRGGPDKIKPYGYAVFQALHNRSTDYNKVINILDAALGDKPASGQGS